MGFPSSLLGYRYRNRELEWNEEMWDEMNFTNKRSGNVFILVSLDRMGSHLRTNDAILPFLSKWLGDSQDPTLQ